MTNLIFLFKRKFLRKIELSSTHQVSPIDPQIIGNQKGLLPKPSIGPSPLNLRRRDRCRMHGLRERGLDATGVIFGWVVTWVDGEGDQMGVS